MDAYSEMVRVEREFNEFIESIPNIINILKSKAFNEMNEDEHYQASSYYRYIESQIKSKFISSIEWYFGTLTRNHFDIYIGNNKFENYKQRDVPQLEMIINDLEKTIGLLKRTVENKP
jgi:hypothetical protein